MVLRISTDDSHCFSKWQFFSQLLRFGGHEPSNDGTFFLVVLRWTLTFELFQFRPLNIGTFTAVLLSSCTKPNCLSCSRTSEIFRFSSSTFQLILNPVFCIVTAACVPECLLITYLFWLKHAHENWTDWHQLPGLCCETRYCDPQKSRSRTWSVQRCAQTGQNISEN